MSVKEFLLNLTFLHLLILISGSELFTKAKVDWTSWANGFPSVIANARSLITADVPCYSTFKNKSCKSRLMLLT